jgi:tetratricopeptide (TPR) repeat protein
MIGLNEAQRRHAEHYRTVLVTADHLYQKGGDSLKKGLLLLYKESFNIHRGRAWAEMHAPHNDLAALLCSDYQIFGAHLFDLVEHPSQRKVWLEIALASARRLRNRFAEASHLNNLGMVYDELGEPQQAIPLYQQRVNIAREIGDLHGEAKSLGNLGVSYKNSGDPVRAIECFEGQLGISQRIHDARGEANALGGLGIAYARRGEMHRAVEYQLKSLKIHRAIGDRRGESNAIGNLAGAYFLLGDMSRAMPLYQQRLCMARELGDRKGEGNALWGISLVSDKTGNRTDAIEHARAALNIFAELKASAVGELRELLIHWQAEAPL